jgi:hypothetical protein
MKKDIIFPALPSNIDSDHQIFYTELLEELQNLRKEVSADRTALRYTKNDAQTISTTTATKVEYDDIDYDLLGEYDTSSHRFTAAYTGKYYIYAQLLTADVAWTAGQTIYLAIYKNNSIISRKFHEIEASVTAYMQIDCEDTLSLNKNDYIEIYFTHNRGSNTDIYSGASAHQYNILNIHRIDI